MEDETEEEDDDQDEEDNSDPPLEFDKRRVAEVIRAGGGNVLASFPGSGMIPIDKLVVNFNNFWTVQCSAAVCPLASTFLYKGIEQR